MGDPRIHVFEQSSREIGTHFYSPALKISTWSTWLEYKYALTTEMKAEWSTCIKKILNRIKYCYILFIIVSYCCYRYDLYKAFVSKAALKQIIQLSIELTGQIICLISHEDFYNFFSFLMSGIFNFFFDFGWRLPLYYFYNIQFKFVNRFSKLVFKFISINIRVI